MAPEARQGFGGGQDHRVAGGAIARPRLLLLANAITLARLCAVPAAVWLVLRHDLHAAFGLFLAAGVSDAIDGWLARRGGGGSPLGAILDPAADKLLLVSMYVTLAVVDVLPDFLAILVVFRDLMIVGGVLVMTMLGYPVAIRPIPVSKLNTALQIALVAVALLLAGFGLADPMPVRLLLDALVWAVAATTIASGAAYLWAVVRRPAGAP
jgi:cardiolipin synthase (CMP-forming)